MRWDVVSDEMLAERRHAQDMAEIRHVVVGLLADQEQRDRRRDIRKRNHRIVAWLKALALPAGITLGAWVLVSLPDYDRMAWWSRLLAGMSTGLLLCCAFCVLLAAARLFHTPPPTQRKRTRRTAP